MSFYRNHLGAIRIDEVVAAFSEEIETIFFEVANEITSFDRHDRSRQAAVQ